MFVHQYLPDPKKEKHDLKIFQMILLLIHIKSLLRLAVTSLLIGRAISSSTDVSALRTPSIIHGV
jgi:hypothetical protein